jgi:hypothetical protein
VIERITTNVKDIQDIPSVQAVVEKMPQAERERFMQEYNVQRTVRLANALGHAHTVRRDEAPGIVTVTVTIPPVKDPVRFAPCVPGNV